MSCFEISGGNNFIEVFISTILIEGKVTKGPEGNPPEPIRIKFILRLFKS